MTPNWVNGNELAFSACLPHNAVERIKGCFSQDQMGNRNWKKTLPNHFSFATLNKGDVHVLVLDLAETEKEPWCNCLTTPLFSPSDSRPYSRKPTHPMHGGTAGCKKTWLLVSNSCLCLISTRKYFHRRVFCSFCCQQKM